jgi:hypothetical protein
MKKMVKKKKKYNSKKYQKGTVGNFFVFGILALLILLGLTAIGGLPSSTAPSSGTVVKIITPTIDTFHNTLQLETFGYTTIAPTIVAAQPPTTSVQIPTHTIPTQPQQPTPPTSNKPVCPDDDDGVNVPTSCQCPDDTLLCISNTQFKILGPGGVVLQDCSKGGNCGAQLCGVAPYASSGRYCVAKPVIYLYPTVPTYVNVQVITSGRITVSNPAYPQGGWKDVLAYPNGNLLYNNQKYTELFYESSVNTFQKPDQGIVIPTSELEKNLNDILSKLGLITSEKKEFMSFWLPKLQALNSPFIFFSILPPSSKGEVDDVGISPKPDTQIAFIAYFKPINTPDYGSSLTLPPTPQRVGFTSVEWGGVVDK